MKSLRFNKSTLSIDDLVYLNKLLETNLSLTDSFSIITTKRNKEILDAIIKQLDSGQLIENIIEEYLPKQIKDYFMDFINNMSFLEALSFSLQFYFEDKDNQDNLLKSLTYPLILLFITITSMYLFDLYGIDMIFSLVSSFKVELGLIKGIRIIISIIIKTIFYLFLISVLLFIYLRQPQRITLIYMFFSKHFPDSLINVYYCQQFMKLFLICVHKGYKSKQTLEILKHIKAKTIVAFLAFHLDEGLSEGDLMKDTLKKKNYYDSSLSRFIKIANYTNDFENVVRTYITFSNERIQKKLKQYTLTIQCMTYSFIGVIVLFIYQILFLPMQAILAY